MFEPIRLTTGHIIMIMSIFWIGCGILNYPVIAALWHHANFGCLPKMMIKAPKLFTAFTFLGAMAMLFYFIAWLTFLSCGMLYVPEGVAIFLYLPAAAYFLSLCEAACYKKDRIMNDELKCTKSVKKWRLVCGYFSITIFVISSIPISFVTKSVLG